MGIKNLEIQHLSGFHVGFEIALPLVLHQMVCFQTLIDRE